MESCRDIRPTVLGRRREPRRRHIVRRRTLVASGLAILVLVIAAPAAAHAAFAPLDRPGPKLSVPKPKLRAALDCTGHVATADRAPILLVPGTALNPRVNFSWNW